LALLAPRHPRVFRDQNHAPNTGGLAISWLEALRNLGAVTTQEKEIDTDASSSAVLSESLTQQGDKSAKRGKEGLLSLLAPPHVRNSESCAVSQGCQAKGNPTKERLWLGALKSLEEKTSNEEKRATGILSPSVDKISESLIQRGAESAKSPAPSPNGEETSGNTTDTHPKEVRRTLVATQGQLAEVIADPKDVGLVALDLETTGLDPREDGVRLLSLATEAATYIVDCQSVDPAELLPILAEVTMVAHNALFDLTFLTSLGFEPAMVADTMILSQLLHAGSRVEPLMRGQTSHSLDSVVKRELGWPGRGAQQPSSVHVGCACPELTIEESILA
jgi:hypothetical protein